MLVIYQILNEINFKITLYAANTQQFMRLKLRNIKLLTSI